MNNYNDSVLKFSRWCTKLIVGLILTLGVISCDDDDNSDYYYVKYIVENTGGAPNGKLNVVFFSEDNTVISIINTNTTWETVIGPVSKNFKAMIETSNRSAAGGSYLATEIQVSKNKGPFVLKTRNDGNDKTIISSGYTIDY